MLRSWISATLFVPYGVIILNIIIICFNLGLRWWHNSKPDLNLLRFGQLAQRHIPTRLRAFVRVVAPTATAMHQHTDDNKQDTDQQRQPGQKRKHPVRKGWRSGNRWVPEFLFAPDSSNQIPEFFTVNRIPEFISSSRIFGNQVPRIIADSAFLKILPHPRNYIRPRNSLNLVLILNTDRTLTPPPEFVLVRDPDTDPDPEFIPYPNHLPLALVFNPIRCIQYLFGRAIWPLLQLF